ncbi:phenylalanine--tRNA ligase subunit beta, partial [Amycolatopsis sp. NPDC000740]
MRVPVSWLTEHLEVDADVTPQDLADAFVRIGIEVDELSELGPVTGPLVVGRVAEIEELTGFKKPVRFCRVEVGEEPDPEPDDAELSEEDEDEDDGPLENEGPHGIKTRGIICGASNFAEGDLVVVALPGVVLPGDFEIAARKTYGKVSDGMICSAAELGLGDDHSGILVLPPGTASPGDDAKDLLGLDDTVIEVTPTPDRGYALSIRGLARELSNALDVPFGDPAMLDNFPEAEGEAWPVRVEDPEGCPRFVLRR